MNKLVLPFSGGCDSSVLLYDAINKFDEIYAITFDYGQRHHKEIECANELIAHAKTLSNSTQINHQILDVKFLRELAPTSSLTNDDIATPNVNSIMGEAQPKSYVPNRNMIFLSIAVARAEAVGANVVWHGAAEADSLAGYWDGSPEFLPAIQNIIRLNRSVKINIDAPLIEKSKKAIVEMGVALKVPFAYTWTCYAGEDLADATSASSSLRLKGFIDAGYKDPIKYKQQESLDKIYADRNCVDIP